MEGTGDSKHVQNRIKRVDRATHNQKQQIERREGERAKKKQMLIEKRTQ